MQLCTTCGARQTGYQPISKRIGFFETSSRGIETLFQSPVRRTPPAVSGNGRNSNRKIKSLDDNPFYYLKKIFPDRKFNSPIYLIPY